jgi:plasmid stabilization system protein ParE
MEYEVILTSAAEHDLADILDYLEANRWHKAAEKLSKAFVSVLNSLAEFPFQFPIAATDLDLRKVVPLG